MRWPAERLSLGVKLRLRRALGRGPIPTACSTIEPHPDLVDDQALEDAAGSSLAAELGPWPDSPLPPCEPRVMALGCACGLRLVRTGCRKQDCPKCGQRGRRGDAHHAPRPWGRAVKQRAHRAGERIEGTGLRYLTVIVLTLSDQARPYGERDQVKQRLAELRRAGWAILKAHGWGWAVENTHPIGDQRTDWLPHFNFLSATDRPRLSPERLVSIKRAWAAVQGLPEDTEAVLEFKWVKVRDRARYRHRLRYFLRCFPGWGKALGLRIRWYGHRPPAPERPECCPTCGERPRYLGTCHEQDWDRWWEEDRLRGIPPPIQDVLDYIAVEDQPPERADDVLTWQGLRPFAEPRLRASAAAPF